ncbi:MAG: inositol monophosphatase family protein [Candidatus Goldiibacteriota bacterium]
MNHVFEKIFNRLRKDIVRGISKRKLSKNSKGDITKYFDKYAEKKIISGLMKYFKKRAYIISEEISKPVLINKKYKNDPYYIIIDPVDGSENYLNDIPFVCMGISVFDSKFEPVYAFAGNYYNGHCYYADERQVRYNGRPAGKETFEKKYLIMTFSEKKLISGRGFKNFMKKFKGIRSMGATIGEIMLVVNGGASVFVDVRNRLTLENFAPFFLAEKHGLIKMTDEKGGKIIIKDMSLSRPYNIVVSRGIKGRSEIIKDLKGINV